MNEKVVNATKWSFITEMIAKLITPVVNMILARILVPEAFGSVATITMIISFAEVFTDAGFQKYIVQHEFRNEKDFDLGVNVAFWSNFGLSLIAVLCIFLFRDNIACLVGEPDLALGIAVASISIIVVSFSSIQMAVYRRIFDFKTLFYTRIISSCIPLVVTIPLAIFLRNYWSLIIGTIVSNTVQAIILSVKSTWKPKFRYSLKKLKEMFSFTSWTLFESISIWLTSYIGTFLVGRELNSYYLGIYKTSMSVVNAYMGIITSAITPVLFSALSRCQNDEKKFQKIFYDFQGIVGVFVLPMGVGMYLYRDLITMILLGSNWMEASEFIGLWGLISAVAVIFSYFYSEVYRSKGKPQISLTVQLIHLCFLIPAIVVSLKYNFKILYITRTFVRLQLIVTNMLIAHYVFNLNILKTLRNIYPQLISSLLMGIVGYVISDIHNSYVWKFVSIFICVVIYFVCLMLFPNTRDKTLNMLKNIKRRNNDDKII